MAACVLLWCLRKVNTNRRIGRIHNEGGVSEGSRDKVGNFLRHSVIEVREQGISCFLVEAHAFSDASVTNTGYVASSAVSVALCRSLPPLCPSVPSVLSTRVPLSLCVLAPLSFFFISPSFRAQHRATFRPKLSRFRGVIRTSGASWGAKYSSKRIGSTCETEEEAAHLYDDFLKKTHPKKYVKFANFCPKCTLFRNPQQVREQTERRERERDTC